VTEDKLGSKMSEDSSKKKEDMTKSKNQTQEVRKTLVVSYQVKPTNRRQKAELFVEFLSWFILSVSVVILVLAISLGVIGVFPDYVPISTANDLLNILINVDGILLGFVGIVFAQLLSSLMDQQNILYQRLLEKPKEALEKKKLLDFMDFRKKLLSLIIVATLVSLLGSIFVSMSNIARNTKFQPTDIYATQGFLFGPLLYTTIAVVLLALALAALPLRPPLEKVQKDNQPKA
jgi:small-conductance mechanosensitive channel